MITVATQLAEAQRRLAAIPEAAERATARAMNTAMILSKEDAVGKITERYAAQPADVRKMITVVVAGPARLAAALFARSPALSLGYFPHTPTAAGTGGPGKPLLHAEVIRGQSKPLRAAFVAPLNSGLRIMTRTGEKTRTGKNAIESVFAVPLATMMGVESVRTAIEAVALGVFEGRLAGEIDRELEAAK